MKRCNRCESPVVKSDNPEYSYQCLKCDEDLYAFETHEDGTEIDDALLEELYFYTTKEYDDEILSEKEKGRYVEIVDTLKAKCVKIPFGIEI